MLIYFDPQTFSNRYVTDITLPGLQNVEITSDLADLERIDLYVAGFGQVTREMLEKAKNLKAVIRNAVGTNNIDKKAAKELGIAVYNLPLVNYESVAEMCVSLVVACARHITFNHMALVNGQQHDYYVDYRGVEIYGKTFGIIGLGHVGSRIIEIMRNAFHVNALVYDPYVDDEKIAKLGAQRVTDYRQLLKESDIVSINVPLTEETRNMINAETLALCKPNCILINTARGCIVDEDALYNALKNHQIMAAASDVFAKEPVDGTNPLFSLPNFIGTSHVAANTEEARKRTAEHLLAKVQEEIAKIDNK